MGSPFSWCKVDKIQKKHSDNPCADEYLVWSRSDPHDTRALPTRCRCNAAGNVATTLWLWLCPADVKATSLFRLLLVLTTPGRNLERPNSHVRQRNACNTLVPTPSPLHIVQSVDQIYYLEAWQRYEYSRVLSRKMMRAKNKRTLHFIQFFPRLLSQSHCRWQVNHG